MEASIYVYTFKEGLLSKLAHDLRLSATRFEINARGIDVEARVELDSLRIDGVNRDGRIERSDLSDSDRRKIRESMLRDVLHAQDHPDVRFTGTSTSREPPFPLEGKLTLAGQTRQVSVLLLLRGERLVGDFELVPSLWGIKPFRALGGTLRVQDRVRIAIDASAEWLAQGQELNPAVELVWTPSTRASLVRSSIRPGS